MDLARFVDVVRRGGPFELTSESLDLAARSFTFLKEYSKGKVIYGINTGFGPMAQQAIPAADRRALQYNLVRSHASGAGASLPDEAVRSMILVRIVTFLKGGSGVSPDMITRLVEYLDLDICPRIPEHGGVGASGDLTQQAHLALGLIGEGEGTYQGQPGKMAEILREADLRPAELRLRDGLALMNGTACMTGVGLLNIDHAQQLLDRAISMSALLTEIIGSWDDHLSAALNGAKKHKGQREVAARMRSAINGSKMVRDRSQHLYTPDDPDSDGVFTDIVQEQYSIRCVPQILGPVFDTINFAENILLDELHSVDDNPFTDPDSGVYHGGNFHGDQVALEMDKLRLAIVKMCMMVERQLNFMLNNNVNRRFPAFLNMERPGITLGLQGMQFTATSTTAENQALATSLYIHSIPTNNDNQDVVSMGANAANATSKVLANTSKVMSVQAIALAQAVDIQKCADDLSPAGLEFYRTIRAACAPIVSTSDPAAALAAVETALFEPVRSWRKRSK